MERHPAKVLRQADVRRVLTHVTRQQCYPERSTVMVLLSFKAGLRACEISGLQWPMVLASTKRVDHQIAITRGIAKCGSARVIPMHPDLRKALVALHAYERRPTTGPVVCSKRGGAMLPGSVVNWFRSVYSAVGLRECSSHSGRRTFITESARILAKTGGSLRDIQELAGHRALTTTERYIEGDRAAQRRLIALL